ncbi:MAG: 4-hydroxyphenylacetate 3-monooxygenase, oxygenase component [Solibacillus sp.]
MPAITGEQYITRINQLGTEVWIDGHRIHGELSEHRALKGIMHSQAALYTMQKDEKLKDVMTFQSPTTNDLVGTSFLQPKTKEDLIKRRQMVQHFAEYHHGLMGRSPDYMNTVITAFACSTDYFQGKENCFPQHLQAYYEYARENDLSITHTFIDPQVNRSKLYIEFDEKAVAATITKQNDEGIIVDGAKLLATQGGITDEIFVMSSSGDGDRNRAFAFAIPSNTRGLKFVCRESFVLGDDAYNYPLSSKFDEIDALVIFDQVFIPWERVFYVNNVQVANLFAQNSLFRPLSLHQVVARQVKKTEFLLDIARKIVDSIQIGEYTHVQQKITEIIVLRETMEALLLKSEHNAKLHAYGYMCPEQAPLEAAILIYPKMYPRMIEIIQLLGASGLVNIPTKNSFQSVLQEELNHFLQSKSHLGEERVRLFRLAWDVTMSPFGTRQTLYERFFFGDPERMAGVLYNLDQEMLTN